MLRAERRKRERERERESWETNTLAAAGTATADFASTAPVNNNNYYDNANTAGNTDNVNNQPQHQQGGRESERE